MRNFQLIAQGVNVLPLLHGVQRQPKLWNQNTLRTTHEASPHTQVDDIWLRFNSMDVPEAQAIIDGHESINWPGWHALPQARPIIFDLMRLVEGLRLGRVLITRLAPGKRIAKHVDGGDHAAYYERYHVMLQNAPGAVFHCGNETVTMLPGQVWWFDNGKEHEVVNNSCDDRITMIVDIKC